MAPNELFAYFNAIAPLSTATWKTIAPLFHERLMAKQAYFVEAGPVADSFAFMSEGVMRVFYRTADGTEYNKHFFTAPTTVGAYSSLVTGQPNLIYQQAMTDCRIWVADYARFNECCDRFPDLERIARRNAELYFARKEQREVELVLRDAGQRYAQFQQEYGHLEQLIPQYHIASYLGVTPTQLSRIRRGMAGR
ncbi:Crp/Fnr family transcriptional regulator [Spirosoma sp. KNUC1025]|uniref:Crp/Fnr family transcriptional regulator n=1 Tax=Spirosoma sp. KNUC1025 TaxID=2894082 RepID=UPI001E65B860|nr:Crp/Fnr family transcriptional regulator [Spirosoma sp. KNUC1025]UFH57756.1 Crp/Fnr family transcriptional regulator [Spirosoma sp. KNUC1025]